MDWPTAAVVLGILGTVAVAIIKYVPQRTIVENAKGEPCATKEDVRAVGQQLSEHARYMGTRNHDIIKAIGESCAAIEVKLEPMAHDLIVVMERTRRFRGANEDD